DPISNSLFDLPGPCATSLSFTYGHSNGRSVSSLVCPKSLHVALRRPETMKRTIVMRFRLCGKIKQDERWSEVDSYLSFNSLKSLTRVAQTRPKLSHRQAPEGR